MIRLFDIQNGKVTPSEHCYTLASLKAVMDNYDEDTANKIYAYVFYMTCPNPDLNPFFDVSEADKEELVLKEIDADFSIDEDIITDAIKLCKKLYETPTYRAYAGIKSMLDRLAKYMETTEIEHGRDGNITALVNAAAKFEAIRQSFKGTLRDLEEEQQSQVRGGQNLAYDQ
jgi:effector-binding domain-containing protein